MSSILRRHPRLISSVLPTSFHPILRILRPILHPIPPFPALPPQLHRPPRPTVSLPYRFHQTPHQATTEAGSAGVGLIFHPSNFVHWGIFLAMVTGIGVESYFRLSEKAEEVIKASTILWEEIKEHDKKRDESKKGGISEGVFREQLLLEIKRIADSVKPPLSAAPSPPQI